MDRIVVSSSSRDSLLSTHKVLRNTYFLLSLTWPSALTATASTMLGLPAPGLLLMLVGFYGLMFLTHKLANSPAGILAAFALTGFMGYALGPILSSFLNAGAGDLIMLALGGTAAVFFCCSAYVLTTRKDIVPVRHDDGRFCGAAGGGDRQPVPADPCPALAISALFILFSAGAILWETSNIIHGGETNYIRATVSLYVSLYNMFISLLSILGFARSN